MTTTKHTPAPWTFSLYKGGASVLKNVADEGMGQTGMHGIAVMNSGNGIMDDANARLIAAAPELLAVVEKLLAVPANQIGDVLMLIPAARAAIAKATGRE